MPKLFVKSQHRHVNPRSVTSLVLDDEGRGTHQKMVSSAEALRVEAKEMSRAAEACSQVKGIGVPVVLSTDIERLTLSTRHISGDSLFNFIWNSTSLVARQPLRLDQAEGIGSRIGSWLRAYHRSSIGRAHNSTEWSELASSGCRKLARVCDSKSFFLSHKDAQQIRGYLKVQAAACEKESQQSPHAQLHGDFTPTNLLVASSGELHVLDFGDSRVGEPWFDCVRFTHDLWAVGQVRRRRSVLRTLEKSFWIAYGTKRAPLQHEFMKCWNSLCFLSSYVSSRHLLGFTGRWAARRLTRIHSRWLKTHIVQDSRRCATND